MGLGAVLNKMKLVLVAYGLDGIEIRRLAEEMDRDDRLGLCGDLRLDLGRIDVKVLVNVDEDGFGAGLADRLGGGDEAIGKR